LDTFQDSFTNVGTSLTLGTMLTNGVASTFDASGVAAGRIVTPTLPERIAKSDFVSLTNNQAAWDGWGANEQRTTWTNCGLRDSARNQSGGTTRTEP
jgi:hypothetical protein